MISKEKRDEAFEHNKPYLKDKDTMEDLLQICERCENFCGNEHDFEECRNKPCFELWLSNEYLEWCDSYKG